MVALGKRTEGDQLPSVTPESTRGRTTETQDMDTADSTLRDEEMLDQEPDQRPVEQPTANQANPTDPP